MRGLRLRWELWGIASGALVACGVFGGSGTPSGNSATDSGLDDAGTVSGPIVDSAPPFDGSADPLSCGAPQHSCLGGNCLAGVCQPFTVVPDVTAARGLAIDPTAGELYFTTYTTSGVLEKVGVDGSGLSPIFSSLNKPNGVAISSGFVFFAVEGAGTFNQFSAASVAMPPLLNSIPVFSGPSNLGPTEVQSSANGWVTLVTTEGYVFGFEATAPFTLPSASGTASFYLPSGLSTDGTYAYFLAGTGSPTVQRIPIKGVNPNLSTSSSYTIPGGTAVSESIVFFVGSGMLWILPTTSSGFGTPGPAGAVPSGGRPYLGGDGKIYIASPGPSTTQGSILVFDNTNNKVTTIASGQANPYQVVADDQAVYWTNFGSGTKADGAVMKVAK